MAMKNVTRHVATDIAALAHDVGHFGRNNAFGEPSCRKSSNGCFLSKNIVFSPQNGWFRVFPQIIHFNRVFHYFHHPFWVFSPIFGNIYIIFLEVLSQIFFLDVATGYPLVVSEIFCLDFFWYPEIVGQNDPKLTCELAHFFKLGGKEKTHPKFGRNVCQKTST